MRMTFKLALMGIIALASARLDAQTLTIETVTPDPLAGSGTVDIDVSIDMMGTPHIAVAFNILYDEANLDFVSITCAPGAVTCSDLTPNDGSVGVGYLSPVTDGLIATLTLDISNAVEMPYVVTSSPAVYTDPGFVDQNLTVVDGGFTITPVADLSLTKTDLADPVVASSGITYTLSTNNAGPSDATNVTVTDTLPAGVIFGNATGTGWACSESGGVVTCTRASLAASASSDITVNVTAPANGTLLTNMATIGSDTLDTNLGDNSDSEDTTVTSSADLAITKSDAMDPVVAAGTIVYTLSTSNAGPSDATTVQVLDTLPAGVGFVSATGPGWACGEAGGTVTCVRATFAAAAANDITVTVTAPNNGAMLTNTANISSAIADPDSNNNMDSEDTTVTSSADLSLTKTDAVDPIVAANDVVYTVSVANAGPSDADTLTMTDTLPAGVTFVSAIGAGWSCMEAAGIVTCTRATFAAAANSDITITVTAPDNGTTLNNSATVGSTTPDPDGLNNSDAESTLVTSSADLSITKDDGVTEVNPADGITYTIVVANAGPSDVTGATVTDTFPTDIQGVAWTCTPMGAASCGTAMDTGDISESVDLPSGSSVTFSASGTINILATGTLSNTASVSAGISDPDTGNNSDTHLTPVNLPPQVASTTTVARPNGSLAAITQVYVTFDEDVIDADMPAAFQIVANGLDGVIDTTLCGPPANDDFDLVIDSVSYDAPSRTSRLAVNGGVVLPRDGYAVLACATITDPEFNPLDGNADRLGGDDFVLPQRVSVEHLLVNPNLDNDIAGWTIVDPLGGTVLWDPTDSDGAPTSGSMSITDITGSGSTWTASQCGQANAFDGQALAAQVRITSPSGTAPTVSLSTQFFASVDCSGPPLSTVNGASLDGDTSGLFMPLQSTLGHTDETDPVQSALYLITVDGGAAATFEVLVDDGVFYIDGLFDDSFEGP